METNNGHERAVTFDADGATLIIKMLKINDPEITREARRWPTGSRGEAVDDLETLAAADLTPFLNHALRLGVVAIDATGTAQDRFGLERLIKDVGEQTVESSTKAAQVTSRAVREATEAVTKASEQARKSIADADAAHRTHLSAAVKETRAELNVELQRIFGGENPELVERLRPLLDKFGSDLDGKVSKQTEELLGKAARQFDPSDPTSPMAKHAAALATEQQRLAEVLSKNHAELAAKVEELTAAVKVQTAVQERRAALVKVTPIKGSEYETDLNVLLAAIAAGLGDEYIDTSRMAGRIPRRFKGDGLLTIDGGAARVVIEMSDSSRADWNGYLEIAERNREAAASLGLVRTSEQNADQSIRVLGSRRIVLAFDPATDDPNLLRTVVMLLRTASIAACGRHGAEEIATAEEKISGALEQLAKIGKVKKLAGSIQRNADKIERECDTIAVAIGRLLSQALTALEGSGQVSQQADLRGSPQDGAA
jgi:hypothetical protein